MELLTLGDVKSAPEVEAVAKFCPSSPEFVALVNQVVRKLSRRGDWIGTVVPIYTCVRKGCVVWPRYVGNVRRINICNRSIPVRNLWYEFMDGAKDVCHHGWENWRGPECSLQAQGSTSVFQDIQGDGRTIRSYTRCNADLGKKATFFGIDNNGQPLQTDNKDGTFSPGIVITNAVPFGSSSTFVRRVDYVIRDATQCPVDYYAYNATTDLLEELAHYEPSETNPTYEKSRLGGNWTNFTGGCTSSCCSATMGVLALVKLKFIPAQADTDLILVPNIDSIVLGIQAAKSREAGDLVSMAAFQTAAVQELNRDIEDNSPDDQFSVIDNTFGGTTFRQQCF